MTELLPTETPTKNSDWAVIALISGIGGLTFLPLIDLILDRLGLRCYCPAV